MAPASNPKCVNEFFHTETVAIIDIIGSSRILFITKVDVPSSKETKPWCSYFKLIKPSYLKQPVFWVSVCLLMKEGGINKENFLGYLMSKLSLYKNNNDTI